MVQAADSKPRSRAGKSATDSRTQTSGTKKREVTTSKAATAAKRSTTARKSSTVTRKAAAPKTAAATRSSTAARKAVASSARGVAGTYGFGSGGVFNGATAGTGVAGRSSASSIFAYVRRFWDFVRSHLPQ
ncbi:MAG: hypothetical protein ACTJLL_02795 [Anaplasma sp.]